MAGADLAVVAANSARVIAAESDVRYDARTRRLHPLPSSDGMVRACAMSETTQLASVVVERPKRGRYLNVRDRWRSYWIEIDGQRVGKVRIGQRLVTPVTAGRHIVRARIDWTGSPKVHVDLHSGEEVVLNVHPAGGPLDTSQVIGRDEWLALYVAIDE